MALPSENIVQNLISAASRAASSSTSDFDDFEGLVQETRRSFRRRQTSNGRKKSSKVKKNVFLFRRNNVDFVPTTKEINYLNENNMGKREKAHFERHWSVPEIESHIHSLYPNVPLNLIGFQLGKCDQSRKIVVLSNINSMEDVLHQINQGSIYVIPNRDIPMDEVRLRINRRGEEVESNEDIPRHDPVVRRRNPARSRHEYIPENVSQEMSLTHRPHRSTKETVESTLPNFGLEPEISGSLNLYQFTVPTLPEDAEKIQLEINRSNCSNDLFKFYSEENVTEKRLLVTFTDEIGVDGGGLTKEMFNLFFSEIEDRFFRDLILDIAESYIYIEGKFIPNDLAKTCHLSNNALAFLFDEIRYEMGGEQVCLIRKPGITTTMKSMISYGETSTKFLDTVGWGLDENKQVILDTPSHTFSGKLPLKFLMGFAEDYNKGILNIKQELILIIARSFKNSYMGEVDANVTINKIEWKIRHVMPSDRQKLKLLNRLNKSSTAKIKLAYRMCDLYELPAIRETASDIWAIKTTSSLERPRYIIIGFQSSDNTDDRSKDATKFIHAGVNNIRLYLNSEVYPYERWNLDFDRKLDAVAFYAYENFQRSYYGKDMGEPMMSIEEFRKNPLFIIDCYHQPDAMKTSTVDIKLEFETRETKFPPNTKVHIAADNP
ncbi:unnamed protein product [Phaedon cochleariae]|uniref:HECT domain-containing protein n=1 Tax=Phaedon cochleariae TaxID=80249 RepID=A0A9N9SFV8_PHACE|nr:unnamed protein product [Phaedon cochleariae]